MFIKYPAYAGALGIAKSVGLWIWMFIFNRVYTAFLKSQCDLPVMSLKRERPWWFEHGRILCSLEVGVKSGISLKNTF